MKQITLRPNFETVATDGPCVGKSLTAWALYGYAMWMLWQWTAGTALGQGFAWAIGMLAGLALAAALRGA